MADEARALIFRPIAEVFEKLEARLLAETGIPEFRDDAPEALRMLARHAKPGPGIRVAERIPPTRLVIEPADGDAARVRGIFELNENPAGTTVRFTAQAEGTGLKGLAAKAGARILQQLGPKLLREVKDEIEGRAAPPQ